MKALVASKQVFTFLVLLLFVVGCDSHQDGSGSDVDRIEERLNQDGPKFKATDVGNPKPRIMASLLVLNGQSVDPNQHAIKVNRESILECDTEVTGTIDGYSIQTYFEVEHNGQYTEFVQDVLVVGDEPQIIGGSVRCSSQLVEEDSLEEEVKGAWHYMPYHMSIIGIEM